MNAVRNTYVGVIFLIAGFVLLRFTFHEGAYLFPTVVIAIGFILLAIAVIKSKIKNKKEN